MVARSLAAIPVLIFMVCILSWCRRRQETAPLQRDECPSLEYRFQSAAYNSLCTHSNNQRKRSSNDAANRLRELRQDGRARGGDQLPRQDVACRDRKRVVWGQRCAVRVDLGGRRISKQNTNNWTAAIMQTNTSSIHNITKHRL